MEYLLTDTPDDELKTRIKKQLGRYNAAHMTADAQELIISMNDAQGELCAGLTGRSYWGCLHIEFLWVDESLRGQGTGTALMAMAEEEGRKRGCKRVFVDTLVFRRRNFTANRAMRFTVWRRIITQTIPAFISVRRSVTAKNKAPSQGALYV